MKNKKSIVKKRGPNFLINSLISGIRNNASYESDGDSAQLLERDLIEIPEFLVSPYYCNEAYNPETKLGVRPKIVQIMRKICEPQIREAMIILGAGSGKDYFCSRLVAYTADMLLRYKNPQRYLGFADGEPIYLINVATNEEQAQNLFFAYLKAVVQKCPTLDNRAQILEKEIRFEKNIIALSGDTSVTAWYGYHVLRLILDEICFFPKTKNKDVAKDMWLAGQGSITHGFLSNHQTIIGISTAGEDDCFAEEKFDELEEQMKAGDPTVYVARLASWDVIPGHKITDHMYAKALRTNYNWAMAKYGAQKTKVEDPYFTKDEVQRFDENMKNSNVHNAYLGNGQLLPLFKPIRDMDYYLHIDLSSVSDRTVLCLGHLHGFKVFDDEKLPIIMIDLLCIIDPKAEKYDEFFVHRFGDTLRVNFAMVRHFIYKLRGLKFNIANVSFDKFNSEEMHQKLTLRGFTLEQLSTDTNRSISDTGKVTALDGRVLLPYSDILLNEVKGLRDIGKKIDHPRHGYKDTYDAVCCVTYKIIQIAEQEEGVFVPLFSDVEDEADFFGYDLQRDSSGTPMTMPIKNEEDDLIFVTSDED